MSMFSAVPEAQAFVGFFAYSLHTELLLVLGLVERLMLEPVSHLSLTAVDHLDPR